MPKKERRLIRLAWLGLTLPLSLVLAWLGAVGIIYLMGKAVPAPAPTDAMIVLGAQVLPDGDPNLILLGRLRAALDAYRQHPRFIICCGAQGDDEPAPEGAVMRDWLIENGVPPYDVIAETGSYNTRENLENAKELLPESVDHVLVVTSDYHLPRAMALAGDMGLTPEGSGSEVHWRWRLKNHTREALSWGKYWLEKLGILSSRF